jgi:hypothetical protein
LSSIGRLDKYVLGKSVNNALAILIWKTASHSSGRSFE